jgi:hypothetical protein
MGRTLGMLLFAVSLTANAQVVIYGGYATQMPTGTPLLAPPNAALPGSGNPVGAPVDINANNARFNGTGQVFIPDAQVATSATINPAAGVNNTTSANNAGTPGNTGQDVQTARVFTGIRFAADQAPTNATAVPAHSLGEIAAQYRDKKAQPADRHIDNTDVLALNNTATFRGQTVELPQSDQPPVDENGNPIGTPRADNDQSGDQQVLDKNDLRDVEAAVKRSKERQKQQAQPQEQPR